LVGSMNASVATPNLPHPELVEGRSLFVQVSVTRTHCLMFRFDWTFMQRPSTSSGWGSWWIP
jgi:hypothetical protein